MRLITFSLDTARFAAEQPASARRVGIQVLADSADLSGAFDVVDLSAESPFTGMTMRTLLEGGEAMFAQANAIVASGKHRIPGDKVRLLAPIYDPEKVICIGMNYLDHCTEQNIPVPTEPLIFNKFPSSISGPDDVIPLEPDNTQELDFEVELCVVMGKTARRVTREDAMKYVAGYSVAHDVSARDLQLKKNGGQWLLGKTADGYAPLGPAIVTADEIDPSNLKLRCSLNGNVVQDSSTKELVFDVPALVSYMSRFFTLKAGDVVLTGTPPGVGCFRKPPLFLKDGDMVTVEIEKIGSITNPIKTMACP